MQPRRRKNLTNPKRRRILPLSPKKNARTPIRTIPRKLSKQRNNRSKKPRKHLLHELNNPMPSKHRANPSLLPIRHIPTPPKHPKHLRSPWQTGSCIFRACEIVIC